jgi:glucosamine--fructose-6-phosphate aminotransferase (isomerizing)
LRAQLDCVAARMQDQIERGTGRAAIRLAGVARCAVTGRGPNYATAFEAALKIKELAGVAAEPYSPADLMHGPVAVLDPATPLVAFVVAGPSRPSVLDAIRAAHARDAEIVTIADHAAGEKSAADVPLVAVPEWLSPLVAILPAQTIAAQLALERGVTVDEPFGLAKVTRTV